MTHPGDQSKECLNHVEYKLATQAFIDVFDILFKSIVINGDKEELIAAISKIVSEVKTHKLLVPRAIQNYTTFVFTNEVFRDFVLELIENLSAEVACIGPIAYKRLINTLSLGISESKAVEKSSAVRLESPAILAIHVSFEDAKERFLANPWLVVLVLLVRNFRRTEIGLNTIK